VYITPYNVLYSSQREYLVVAKCNSFVAKIRELRQDIVKSLPHARQAF
jgi:hypothetical protein